MLELTIKSMNSAERKKKNPHIVQIKVPAWYIRTQVGVTAGRTSLKSSCKHLKCIYGLYMIWFGFYGILSLVGYIMPNPLLYMICKHFVYNIPYS